MGYEKSRQLEDEERGYRSINKFVCADCVDDEYLRQLIRQEGADGECDYCSATELKGVLNVDAIMPCVAAAMFRESDNPARAGVPRDEGEYIVPTFPTSTALMFTGLDCDLQLFNDIADAFVNDEWTLSYGGSWLGTQPSQELSSLWEEFVQAIKHRTRFFFREEGGSDTSERPHQILERIYRSVVRAGLIRSIESGTSLYRCRLRNVTDNWEIDKDTLGPPPESRASAGRMNPAGIAYLYTGRERSTALGEVVGRPPFCVVVGTFETTRALHIVDLSNLPTPPSAFDESRLEERETLLFLWKFAGEISQPIGKDGAEHVDYVPSQVVCEYFAQVVNVNPSEHEPIDGLCYPSAVMQEGRNLVLFPTDRTYTGVFEQVKFTKGEKVNIDDWQELIRELKE
jgi:RES domain-containing protein